jgi:hypothetical protein
MVIADGYDPKVSGSAYFAFIWDQNSGRKKEIPQLRD